MATIFLTSLTTPPACSQPPLANTRSRLPNAVSWRRRMAVVAAAAPERLSEKIAESVKAAEEKCSEDPRSGECVAAWDEVEELSAAASHVRDRQMETAESDPLEKYCRENPGMGQCRIYED